MTAQQWVDEMEPRWKEVWARLDIAYDDYIRTTEARHTAVVEKLLNAVHDNGAGRHLPRDLRGPLLRLVRGLLHRGRPHRRALSDPRAARRAHGRGELLLPPLRLRGPPARALRAAPEAVQPETRRNEVLSTIRGGLQDFSISRTTFDWGIPLPWDPKHVGYVWFDALTNYITAAGYADDPERFARMWPANIHSIGKDILRFHAIYWPAMLMAGDVEPPTQVWAHGYLTVGGKKMSKTNADGHPPVRAPGRLRRGLVPLLLHARDPVRPGRQLLLRGDGRPPQRRPRQRPRQPRQPRPRDAGEQLRRNGARLHHGGRGVRPPRGDGRRRRPLPNPHDERRALPGPRGGMGHRRESQPLPRREGTLEDQGGDEARRTGAASSTPRPKPSASLRC